MKGEVCRWQRSLFRSLDLPVDELGDVRQLECLIESTQVGLDLARAQEVNACEQDAVDVEQRLYARRTLLLEELPLRLGEATVVMLVVARDQAWHQRLQLLVLGAGMDHQRRGQLLEHVPVATQEEGEELLHVVGDEIELQVRPSLGD